MKICSLGKKEVSVVRIKRVECKENVRAGPGTKKTLRIKRVFVIRGSTVVLFTFILYFPSRTV